MRFIQNKFTFKRNAKFCHTAVPTTAEAHGSRTAADGCRSQAALSKRAHGRLHKRAREALGLFVQTFLVSTEFDSQSGNLFNYYTVLNLKLILL